MEDSCGENVNTIDFVTIATTGNAINFGNLDDDDRHENAAVSNQTRGMIGGGSNDLAIRIASLCNNSNHWRCYRLW